MNYCYRLMPLTLLLSLSACKKNKVACPSQPTVAAKNLLFRVVDKKTGEDLILSNRLNYDSLVVRQGCNDKVQIKEGYEYQLPNKDGVVIKSFVLGLPGLRNPALQEPEECFELYLQWNANDVDTLLWRYHIDEADECKPQLMDGVVFNGTFVSASYDGVYQYYPLPK